MISLLKHGDRDVVSGIRELTERYSCPLTVSQQVGIAAFHIFGILELFILYGLIRIYEEIYND